VNAGYRGCVPLVRRYAEVSAPATRRSWMPADSDTRLGPPPARDGGRRYGDEDRRRAGGRGQQTFELSEFLTDVMGLEMSGPSYRHRVHLPPDCHSCG